jgi:hypothetical protein
METHEILAAFGLALLGMLGYFLRDAHSQIKEAFKALENLRTDFTVQNLNIATDFVRKTELREIEVQLDKFSEALFGKIDSLSQRVDSKFELLTERLDHKIEGVTAKFEKQIDDLDKDFYTQLAKKADKP